MKHKKSLLAVILVVVLLTFAVSGTIAYLMTSTGTVTNQFEPTKVTSKIVEEGWADNGTEKSSVVVKNTGTTSAYIRVAVVGNWCNDEGQIVEPWNETFTLGTEWIQNGDYYYYTKVVPVGGSTSDLLASSINTERREDGTHLVVTVVQQAIQAEGMDSDGNHPVELVWGVKVNDNNTPNDYSDDTISN